MPGESVLASVESGTSAAPARGRDGVEGAADHPSAIWLFLMDTGSPAGYRPGAAARFCRWTLPSSMCLPFGYFPDSPSPASSMRIRSRLLQRLLCAALATSIPALAQVPAITLQPLPTTAIAGQTATFTVGAGGTAPLSYEWWRDGASLGTTNTPSYTTAPTSLADSGAKFHVWVRNHSGIAASVTATLTVDPVAPCSFATWASAIADPAQRNPAATPFGDGVPNLVKYAAGQPANRPANAPPARLLAGDGGWSFRYTRARHATGIATAAERSALLAAGTWNAVPAALVADDGVCETWEAPAAPGTDARAFYRLNIAAVANEQPRITAQPQPVAVVAGQTATFGVTVAGTEPFAYQWRRNGRPIPGATAATLTVPAVGLGDRGAVYTVVVRSEAGTVTSSAATLHVQLQHPFLLFSAGDLPELRARRTASAIQQAYWNYHLADARTYPPPAATTGAGQDIRRYADRLLTLALVQLLDPDQPYNARFREYFFTMLRYANWDDPANPFNNGELTVSHFLVALALAYDWHFEQFSAEEKAEIQTRLARYTDTLLLNSYLRVRDPRDWAKLGTLLNNHSWITNGAAAAVAIALSPELPESRWKPWLDRSETNLANILRILPADGVSPEGATYHSYGLSNLILWLEMRDRYHGTRTMETNLHLQNAARYQLYSVLPGGADNYGGPAPFGDCLASKAESPRTLHAWLARRGADPHAQWAAQSLDWVYRAWPALLWYDAAQPAADPGTLPTWRLFPEKGLFVWRSSWANDAVYFSLKCGPYEGGHEHPDAGHFILERAGVPYFTDERYSYLKLSDDHNLLLVDGQGQRGEGVQWMTVQNPTTRGRIPVCLAEADYFDLLADPSPRYGQLPLQSWQREVLGFLPGLFVVRDEIRTTTATDLDLLLHSYRTAAPPDRNSDLLWLPHVAENPWAGTAPGRWSLAPRDGAATLHLAELSAPGWAPTLEASWHVPATKFDTGAYNGDFVSYQRGYRLRRRQHGTAATSIQAFWFASAEAGATRLTVDGGEGVAIAVPGSANLTILWPHAGQTATSGEFAAAAAMVGRRRDQPSLFGRAVTHFAEGPQLLVHADVPIDLFARLEHTPDATAPAFARITASSTADILLHCPARPANLAVDGAPHAVEWADGLLHLRLAAGSSRIEVSY